MIKGLASITSSAMCFVVGDWVGQLLASTLLREGLTPWFNKNAAGFTKKSESLL